MENSDLTVGNIKDKLLRLCIPLLLSITFQQLYSIVDSVVVGRFVGTEALAAVGNSYFITMLYIAVGSGFSVGTSVIVSNRFGAKDYSGMKCSIWTSLISITAVAVVLMVAGMFANDGVLRLLGVPDEIFADSAAYLSIYVFGVPFLFAFNALNGVFTAMGDSNTPLVMLIVSSVLNIVLDVVFVAALDMGVRGVAWATFIAQGVAMLLSGGILVKRIAAIKSERYSLFSWRTFGRICRISLPSIMQQSFVSVGNLFIQGRINTYGADVIAGYSAAIKLNSFTTHALVAYSNGVSSFTAQNYGANEMERTKRGAREGMIGALILAGIFTLIYLCFSRGLIGLFAKDASEEMISTGAEFLRIVSPFYLMICFKLIPDAVMRGMGYMFAFVLSTLVDLIIRVALAFLLSNAMGAVGIWWSWPIGWFVATAISFGFYLSGAHLKKRRDFGEIPPATIE